MGNIGHDGGCHGNDYIFFMHDDVPGPRLRRDEEWTAYLARLRAAEVFLGGSAIGDGLCVSRSREPPAISRRITGYIKVRAISLTAARELVAGNPVYEAGGTVEIRELPRTS